MEYNNGLLKQLQKDGLEKLLSKIKNKKDNTYSVNYDTLSELALIFQKTKNANRDYLLLDYLSSMPLIFDANNINNHIEDLKSNIILRQFFLLLCDAQNVVASQDYSIVKKIILELFDSNLYENEKKKIADISAKLFPNDGEIKLKMVKYTAANVNTNASEIDRMKQIYIKTNGFFGSTANVSNKSRIRENNVIKNEIISSLHFENNEDTNDIFDAIEDLFVISKDDLEEQDYIQNAQLKKIKIFLLLKAVNLIKNYQFQSEDAKIEIIRNIIDNDDKILETNKDNLSFFAEQCDFDSSIYIQEQNEKYNPFAISGQDIVDTSFNVNGNSEILTEENLLLELQQYNDIEFIPINNCDNFGSSFIVKHSDDRAKISVLYSDAQKDRLLELIYTNKELCDKILNSNDRKTEKNEITDFIKIMQSISKDAVKTETYKDVYMKYYLHEEDKGLGGVDVNSNYQTRSNSECNFINNDYSQHIVSTAILFEWLKTQFHSGNHLNEMQVTVSDIENLPKILQEYSAYVNTQMRDNKNGHFTPVSNLVIKSEQNIDPVKAEDIIESINKTVNKQKCFNLLKIDNYDLNQVDNEINNDSLYVLYGENGFFGKSKNIRKLNNQQTDSLFQTGNFNKQTTFDLKKVQDVSKIQHKNYNFKLTVQGKIDDYSQKIKNLLELNDDDNSVDINMDMSTDTDTDVDLDLLLNLKKAPPQLEGLREEDCITANNIDSKIKELLQPDNKRFSDDTKKFLSNFFTTLNASPATLFNKITNADSISASFKNQEFKGNNARFTPEAFIHILYDYVKFGTSRWNGLNGDPELAIYQITNKNGAPAYVVAKSMKNIKDIDVSPIGNIFRAMPLHSIDNNEKTEQSKYSQLQQDKIKKDLSDISSKLSGNILKVFVQNPQKVSIDYAKYISDHKDELISFINKISNNPLYKAICDSTCQNFCKEQKVGNLKQLFSLIDPVSLSYGLDSFFNLLDELKRDNFINDTLIEEIPMFLSKNKYAVQNLYYSMIDRKIKVTKAIIEYRKNNNELIDVDINDPKELLRYIKYNPIRTDKPEELSFAQMNFAQMLKPEIQKDYIFGTDVFLINDLNDSFCCIPIAENSNAEPYSYFDTQKQVFVPSKNNSKCRFYADTSNLLLLLNSKYERLPDGTIHDAKLSATEKIIVQNKVKIFHFINSNIKNDNNLENDQDKQKVFIFINAIKYIRENNKELSNAYLDTIIDQINNLNKNDLSLVFNDIQNNNQNAISSLSRLSLNDQQKNTLEQLNEMLNDNPFFQQVKQDKRQSELLSNYLLSYVKGTLLTDFPYLEPFQRLAKFDPDNIQCWANIMRHAEFVEMQILNITSQQYDDVIKYILSSHDTDLSISLKNINNIDTSETKKLLKQILQEQTMTSVQKVNLIKKISQSVKNGLDIESLIQNLHEYVKINLSSELSVLLDIYNGFKATNPDKTFNIKDCLALHKIMKQKGYNFNGPLDGYSFNFRTDVVYFNKLLATDLINIKQKSTCLEHLMAQDASTTTEDEKTKTKNVFYNFVNLITDLEQYCYDKNKSIILDPSICQNIIAKSFEKYKQCISKKQFDDFNKTTQSVLKIIYYTTMINEAYEKAISNNDDAKQTRMINLIGKLNLFLQTNSLEQCEKILDIIGNYFTTDIDILNKFDYISEHIKEDGISYESVNKLYAIDNKQKYLNSGFTHSELMQSVEFKLKQQNEKQNIIDSINKCGEGAIEQIETEMLKNGVDTQDNKVLAKVKQNINKIKNKFRKIIDFSFEKNLQTQQILEKINKSYFSKNIISPATILQTDNIALLEEIVNSGTGGLVHDAVNKDVQQMKDTLEYISEITSVFLSMPTDEIKTIFTKLDEKARTEGLTDQEKLQLISAFCAIHVKEQNKALHIEQLAAVILANYMNSNGTNDLNRNIFKLGTGVGKTLTVLFGMYYNSSIQRQTTMSLTTNQLLVNEMMAEAEKNSIYKNRIYYINDKQEIINKATNKKIPTKDILALMKDTRNVFFSTYSNFDFWRKKLLLNEGKAGLQIAKYVNDNVHALCDEVDSVMDASTSNKISVQAPSGLGLQKYKLLKILHSYYNNCLQKNTLNDDFNIDKLLSSEDDEQLKIIQSEICKQFAITNISDLSEENKLLLNRLLLATITANRYQDNVHYTVENVDGYNVIYPIQNGSPNKNGAKYEQDVDMALKIKLEEQGYHFKNIASQTQIISESSNFGIFNFFKSCFGVSGTISGDQIWGKNGFSIVNIQSTYPKFLKTNVQQNFVSQETDPERPDFKLAFILMAEALRDQKKDNNSDFDKKDLTVLKKVLYEAFKMKYPDLNGEWKSYNQAEDDELINIINNRSRNKNYCLTVMQDSKTAKKYAELMKGAFRELTQQNGYKNIQIPDISILDKSSNLVDDESVKEKLKNNPNTFVFALPDRARGFDFPGSPHLIATWPTYDSLNKQIIGRTARNDRPGLITYAYMFPNNLMKKKGYGKKLNDKQVDELMKLYEQTRTEEFNRKNNYYELISEISDKCSIFLNIITNNCLDKKEEIYQQAQIEIAKYLANIKDNFDNIETKFREKQYKEPEIALKEYNDDIQKLKEDSIKNLSSLYSNIYRHAYIQSGKSPEEIDTLSRKVNEIYKTVSREKPSKNAKVQSFKPVDLKVSDRDKAIEMYQRNESHVEDNYIFYTFYGSATGCNYKTEIYNVDTNIDKNENLPDLTICKKQTIEHDDNLSPYIKTHELVFLRDLDDKDRDNVISKIKTLSPDAIIAYQTDNCVNFVSQEVFLNNSIKTLKQKALNTKRQLLEVLTNNNKNIQNIEQVANGYYLSESIKYITEHHIIPDVEFIAQKYKDEIEKIKQKVEISGDGDNVFGAQQPGDNKAALENFLQKNIQNYYRGAMKNGYIQYFCNKTGQIPLESINADDIDAKIQEYEQLILQRKNFLINLDEQIMNDIQNNKKTLSEDICIQINQLMQQLIHEKEIIADDDDLPYEKKQQLLSKYDNILSAENLSSQATRIINLVATQARMESISLSGDTIQSINDLDLTSDKTNMQNDTKWANDITLDNVEDYERKIENINKNYENVNAIGNKITQTVTKEEQNLKQMLATSNNNIQENINLIQNNIDRINFYKKHIDMIKNKPTIFTDFNQKQTSYVTQNAIENIIRDNHSINDAINNDNHLTDIQKKDVASKINTAQIDAIIDTVLSDENIHNLFDHLAINNYEPGNSQNDILFGMNIPENQKKTISKIIHLYQNMYKNNKNLLNTNDANDEPEQQEDEEELENNKEKHELFSKFKTQVRDMLIATAEQTEDDDKIKTMGNILLNMVTGLKANYDNNKQHQENLINNISSTIQTIGNSFKKKNTIHDEFKTSLLKSCKENIPNFPTNIDINNITSKENMSTIINELKKTDIPTMRRIQELVKEAAINDVQKNQQRIKQLEEKSNNLSPILKAFLAIFTVGTIFLTKKGRNIMFNKHTTDDQKQQTQPKLADPNKTTVNINKNNDMDAQSISSESTTVSNNNHGQTNYNNTNNNIKYTINHDLNIANKVDNVQV